MTGWDGGTGMVTGSLGLRACFAPFEYSDIADIVILAFRYYDYSRVAFFWKLELNASI
jgi:hypothetical protein